MSRKWELKKCVWSDQVKAAVKRKEVLGARDKDAREKCLEIYKEEKKKVKRSIYQSKEEVKEWFERKVIQDVTENRKLFRKEVSKANGEKVVNSNKIKDGN